jgi:hypothetical protein
MARLLQADLTKASLFTRASTPRCLKNIARREKTFLGNAEKKK